MAGGGLLSNTCLKCSVPLPETESMDSYWRAVIFRAAGVLIGLSAVMLGLVQFDKATSTRYITPLAASISADGTEVAIEVPWAGGCAEDSQFPEYWDDGGELIIWVEESTRAFHCLVGCLAAESLSCSETLYLAIDPPRDPATPIVFAHPGPDPAAFLVVAVLIIAALLMFRQARRLRKSPS